MPRSITALPRRSYNHSLVYTHRCDPPGHLTAHTTETALRTNDHAPPTTQPAQNPNAPTPFNRPKHAHPNHPATHHPVRICKHACMHTRAPLASPRGSSPALTDASDYGRKHVRTPRGRGRRAGRPSSSAPPVRRATHPPRCSPHMPLAVARARASELVCASAHNAPRRPVWPHAALGISPGGSATVGRCPGVADHVRVLSAGAERPTRTAFPASRGCRPDSPPPAQPLQRPPPPPLQARFTGKAVLDGQSRQLKRRRSRELARCCAGQRHGDVLRGEFHDQARSRRAGSCCACMHPRDHKPRKRGPPHTAARLMKRRDEAAQSCVRS